MLAQPEKLRATSRSVKRGPGPWSQRKTLVELEILSVVSFEVVIQDYILMKDMLISYLRGCF